MVKSSGTVSSALSKNLSAVLLACLIVPAYWFGILLIILPASSISLKSIKSPCISGIYILSGEPAISPGLIYTWYPVSWYLKSTELCAFCKTGSIDEINVA